jgi:hypothetical protein
VVDTFLMLAVAVSLFTTPPIPSAPPVIRSSGDHFEIVVEGVARPIFFRGVNIGAGSPGHFPGEFAFSKEDYRRYLRFASELHANAVRVYTLHPPSFYEALREENEAHPDRPLWLFQEVWTELPEQNDFMDPAFTRQFVADIRTAVDALHGSAIVAPRPGHASGAYTADVSPWLAGWLLGREWEPYAVHTTDTRHPDASQYLGRYLAMESGTAMESWLARMCDTTAAYEGNRYGLAHAVSFVNWPTLDVMRHPTETERGGRQADHDEDSDSVDPTRIRPLVEPGVRSGFLGYFATYHVYPYYPDFMNLDPGYNSARDRHGSCNYAGYLEDLKRHTAGLPLLIGEFGVPTSRGIAHLQPQGIHHGGASEEEQGAHTVRLLEDIEDSGSSGALLFEMFDEWFKVSWIVWNVERPRDRDPLWHNLLDPEESYGLIAFDPPSSIGVDGDVADWSGIAPYATAGTTTEGGGAIGTPIRSLFVTSDQARFYLRLDLDPQALRGGVRTLGVSLDVLDSGRGDRRLPAPLDASWSRGAEFVLVIEPGGGNSEAKAELFVDRSMNWSSSSRVVENRSYLPQRAPLRPVANDDGAYVPMILETNRERVSRTGQVYPPQHLDQGRLELRREPAPAKGDSGLAVPYEPYADWWLDRQTGVIEVAIPWGLLNIGDPSSRSVLDDDLDTAEVECSKTPGIGILAWATRFPGLRADSLGPAVRSSARALPDDCQFLGPPGTRQTSENGHTHVQYLDSAIYSWNEWHMPTTVVRPKLAADIVRAQFKLMESRETIAK